MRSRSHFFLIGLWIILSACLSQARSGKSPKVSLSPTAVTFAAQAVGTTSAVQFVTVTNTGGATLYFNGLFGITGDFAFAGLGTCYQSLAPAASCTISLNFTPTASGTRTGTVTINDNAWNSPQTIPLTGTGISQTQASPTPAPSPSPVASGSAFYVSTSGSDSASGSATSPWRTIQHAASTVRAGAVIYVAPGTYSESILSNVSGTTTAPIRFVSQSKWGARITGDGTANYAFQINGDYTTLEGFDITNVNPSGHLGVDAEGDYDKILGNHIHDICPNGGHDGLGGAAIVNGGNIQKGYLDVIGNIIHDIGDLNFSWYQVQGIYYGSAGGNCVNNIVYRVQGWGIHLWHYASHINISSNTVFNNMQGGIIVGDGDYPCGTSIGCGLDDYTTVANNIVVFNQAHNYNGSSIGGYGISENGYTGTHNKYVNNLVYGNAVSGFYLQNGLIATGTVSANPLFVNYQADGSGDYRLQPTSPAIDHGTSLIAPVNDFDGSARPYGLGFDIGAYEWHP